MAETADNTVKEIREAKSNGDESKSNKRLIND